MYKSLDLVMLPQKGKAAVHTTHGTMRNSSEFHSLKESHIEGGLIIPYHLYIVSDEEIKEGDWVIFNNYKYIQKITTIYKDGTYRCKCPITNLESIQSKNIFKISASTDTSLNSIKQELYLNGNTMGIRTLIEMPQLPKKFIKLFIEEYNKGNIITKVEVEYRQWSVFKIGQIDHETPTETKLVVNRDLTINIRQVLTKTSWSREEVIKLCKSAWIDGSYSGSILGSEEWIKKNL